MKFSQLGVTTYFTVGIKKPVEKHLRRDSGMDADLLKRKDFLTDPSLPLSVFRMPYNFNIGFRAMHTHEFDEMLIVTGGKALHQYNGEAIPMRRGDVFIIPEGQWHGYEMPAGCHMENINLLFDLSALEINFDELNEIEGFRKIFAPVLEAKRKGAIAPFPPALHLPPGLLAIVSGTINSLENELANEAKGYRFFARILFSKIIGLLSRFANHMPIQESKGFSELVGLTAYIEQNLSERISVSDMAKFAGISQSQLRKKFQELYGESPMHHLQRIRIERSMELLADPTQTVTDIAFLVGMEDSNYYSRIFRKINNCSPSLYREKLLKEGYSNEYLRT